MTEPAWQDAGSLARDLLPENGAPTTVVLTETKLGRVLVREHSPSGLFTLGPAHCFVVTEVAEALTLDIQARVYEEIVLHRDSVERIETVSAILRHEEAEIVAKGPISGA